LSTNGRSFGYGGTNAHTIVDDAYHYLSSRSLTGHHNTILGSLDAHAHQNGNGLSNGQKTTNDDGLANTNALPKLFLWSSNEQSGLDRSSKALVEYLSEHKPRSAAKESQFLDQIASTLSEKRSRLPWKNFAVASSVDELTSLLDKPLNKPLRSSQAPALAFVFTGQGAQWHAMGRELLTYPVYQQSLQEANDYLVTLGCTWNLMSELAQNKDTSIINHPTRSQPICTAIQIALVDLLASWGVKPAVVIGHSSGEIAAAYAKGAITKEDGWKISYQRGRVSASVSSNGAMAAVGLGASAVQAYLDRVTEGLVIIACINSPSGVTLSGDAATIEELVAMLEADKVFVRKLLVKNAYHSPYMAEVAEDYLVSLKDISKPTIGKDVLMFSSVTGALIDGSTLDSQYWVSNMLNPVKFSQAVQSAMSYSPGKRRTTRNSRPFNMFLEIGPHAALQGPLKQILDSQEGKKIQVPYVSMLYRNTNAIRSSLDVLGTLALQGMSPNIATANQQHKSRVSALTDLPPFQWNKQLTYWYESAAGKAYRHRALPRLDLVGALSEYSTSQEPAWRNYLRVEEMPWMEHHKVQGSILYPLSGMIVMVIEASKQVADKTKEIDGFELRDIAVLQAMIVPVDDPVETKLQFRKVYNLLLLLVD
jgi:acyl transferase domain-containing protein